MAGRPKGVRDMKGTKRKNTRFDVKLKQKFLKHLEKHGNVSKAADYVGVSRPTVYLAARNDERFQERIDMAKDKAVANLEDEMEKRIYQGDETLVYNYDDQGEEKLVKKTVSKDNNLLMRALEANDPQKYSKKTHETKDVNVNVSGDSAINKLAEFLSVELPDNSEKEVSEKEVEGNVVDNEEGS